MSAVQNFIFDDDQPHGLRVILRGDDPWFVAKDVCATLGVTDTSQAVEPLDDDEKGACSILTPGGEQQMLVISEGGLYTLILRSRQATTPGSTAHRFRKWVTGELLPQIRKTGTYQQPPNPADGWDWERIGVKLQMVRETRLTLGRKAAAAIWTEMGLPVAGQPVERSSAMQGVDLVQQFLADCTIEDPQGHVQARMLSERYADWARKNEAPAMTERALAMCLDALGIQKSRGRLHTYLGIRLKHISEIAG